MSILPLSAVLEGWVVAVVTMAHHTMLTVARPPPHLPPSSGENRDVTSAPPAHASPCQPPHTRQPGHPPRSEL